MIDLKQYKKVLTFFAHPDDETLAAGATINKLINIGSEIHIAIPATGAFMGTPALINAKDAPHTLAMEDEPLDSRTSDTTRTV